MKPGPHQGVGEPRPWRKCGGFSQREKPGQELGSELARRATLVTLLGEVAGREPPVRWEPPRSGEIVRNYSLIDKARERLGYAPQVPLEDGLRRTYEWFTSLPAAAAF